MFARTGKITSALSDIPTALHNWYRWLKKGGLVAFSCFSETAHTTSVVYRAVAQRNDIPMPNVNEILGTPEKCCQLLEEAGYGDGLEITFIYHLEVIEFRN